MIGGSGGRYSPSEIKLGGRVCPLPTPSAKRWHALYMTPAEALAAAPDAPMQVCMTPFWALCIYTHTYLHTYIYIYIYIYTYTHTHPP